MKNNSSTKIGDLINPTVNTFQPLPKKVLNKTELAKSKLWKRFLYFFKLSTNTDFQINDDTIKNVSLLFQYFLQDEQFFSNPCLRPELSVPSFKKGLLIIGGYGIGKTQIMLAMEKAFLSFGTRGFKFYGANEVVQKFEACLLPNDKSEFYRKMNTGINLFDDITAERIANNFGHINILRDILEQRYAHGKLTHAILNYKEGFEGNVDEALRLLNEKYGNRFYDRMFEMFNIVEFHGKSLRR
jgi:hypothetical protein